MATQISTIGSSFGPRFQLVNVVPATVALGVVVFVVSSGAFTGTPSLADVRVFLQSVGVREAAASVLIILVISVASNPLQARMVKVLEGYWKPVGLRSVAMEVGLASQRQRRTDLSRMAQTTAGRSLWHRLVRSASELWPKESTYIAQSMPKRLGGWYRDVYRQYPPHPTAQPKTLADGTHVEILDRIMPTRLGNTLRYYEDFAGNRYGIGSVRFIPYLYGLADEEQVELISDARLGLDLAVRMVWTWLFAVVFAFIAFMNDGPWLLIPVTCFVLAWLSYIASISSAASYGRALVRLLDLYRFDLLRQLHWPLPRRPYDESRNNSGLLEVLDGTPGGRAGTTVYTHEPDSRTVEGLWLPSVWRKPRGESAANGSM